MTANKTLDILVAEMLGDIGKLHDQVADLKAELPQILGQMQAVIAAQTAKADVLQEPIQKAMHSFIRQELKGLSVAVKEAKEAAVYSFDVDVSSAMRNKMGWVQFKCKQSFDGATKKFDAAVTDSAKLAEIKVSETLNGICQSLQNKIDEIRAERWKGQYVSMLCACVFCGLTVGVLAVYILK